MKLTLILPVLLACSLALAAQKPAADTTIYQVADFLPYPVLNSCMNPNHPNWTEDSIRICGESQLMQIITANMRYPESARQKNVSGTVVVSFVVERDGRMSNFKLLKDIGEGCGEEALRVLRGIDEAGLRWAPALLGGNTVRMQKALPLRFRLEEALPYVINATGDTVYTMLDSSAMFVGGLDSLAVFVLNKLEYPAKLRDSCRTGIIEMALLVRHDGTVRVENQLDYNNLGFDFQFQAIRLANKTNGQWLPAIYHEKAVTSTFPLRVVFKSPAERCAAANDRFDQAMILADEGATLSNNGDQEGAIAKWTEALALHPDNTELLYYRGSTYFSLNRREEACSDYKQIKTLLGVTWFEPLRRILCGN